MTNPILSAQTEATIPPWLQPIWDSLNFAKTPHAILLHGQSGIGKFAFAIELAKGLLCETSGGVKPCNQCEACHWFNTGNHPDFIALVPETHRKLLPQEYFESDEVPKRSKAAKDDVESDSSEKKEKKNISIEETRNAIEGLSIGTHRGGNRVILIYPLELLRSDAANTLLKSLEEPPANTIFLLLADRVERVLPTIRSRCRLLAAPRPERDVGLSWLKNQIQAVAGLTLNESEMEAAYDEQGGAPFAVYDFIIARHHQDDKDELGASIAASRILLQAMAQGARAPWLETAEKIHKVQLGYLLATMQRWVADLQAVSQSGTPRYYPRHLSILQSLSQQAKQAKLLAFWKSLLLARKAENHPLASRIQIEALLSQYQQVFEG